MGERFFRTGVVARCLGVSFVTVKRWIYSGRIKAIKNPAGRWLIPESEVNRLLGVKSEKPMRAIIYARVPSHEQKDHLERQTERLKRYAEEKGYKVVEVFKEAASGSNENRRKLWRALKLIQERKVDVLVVEFKDRLTRFGFKYLEAVVESFGGKLEVAEAEECKDATQKLVEDMISIVTSFCAKLYGIRNQKFQEIVRALRNAVYG